MIVNLHSWLDIESPQKHTLGVSMGMFPERFN